MEKWIEKQFDEHIFRMVRKEQLELPEGFHERVGVILQAILEKEEGEEPQGGSF